MVILIVGLVSVLHVVSCFIAYQIAEAKNRDEIAWAIMGFVFGVVGVIVIYCAPMGTKKDG